MKFKKFLKALFSGTIGAGLFLLLAVFALAITKLAFILMKKDLLFSVYNLGTIVALAAILGLAYGIRAYIKKNTNFKLFKVSWTLFWTNISTSLIFTAATYLILRYLYNMRLSWKGILMLFIVLFVFFYAFSAIFSLYLEHKKKKSHFKNIIILLLFNPVFVMIYLGLFGMIIYNTLYVPCGVTIMDVDKNIYTSNTANLGIESGEKIVSIDGLKVNSLNEIRAYINSLENSKEVVVETEENLYYIKTYVKDDNRYMGLVLKQKYCANKY